MSDELRREVQRLIDANVPEEKIGEFIRSHSKQAEPARDHGTVGGFLEDLKNADWRAAAQGAGGIGGAVLAGGPSFGAGTALGGMLGGVAGGQVYDLIKSMLTDEKTDLGTQNMRAAQDMLFEGAANTLLPPAVNMAVKTGKAMISPAKSMVKKQIGPVGDSALTKLNTLERMGFKPEAGMIGGAEAENLSQSLRNNPGSGNIMREVDNHNLIRSREVVDDVARRLDGGVTHSSLGLAVRDAGSIAEKELYALDAGNFQEVNSRLVDNLPVPRFVSVAEDILKQAEDSPLYNITSTDHIRTARAAIEEIGEGGTLSRNSRNIIKKKAADAYKRRALGIESPEDGTMIALERALQGDVRDSVVATGDRDLLGLWENANKFHADLMGDKKLGQRGKLATLRELMKREEDGDILHWITQKSGKGAGRIKEVFELVPEVADSIRAHVFREMAMPRVGQRAGKLIGEEADEFLPEASMGTFLTNLNKMDKEARDVLFGKAAKEMNELITTADYFASLEKRANFSNTDNIRVWRELTKPLTTGLVVGGGSGQSVTSALVGGGTAIVGKIALDRRMARLMTDPKFVRWLSTTGRRTMVKPTDLAPQMIRLAAIAKTDPATTDDYIAYMNLLGFEIKKTKDQKGNVKDVEVLQ